MRRFVRTVLGVPHLLRDGLTVVALPEHLGKQRGTFDEVAGGLSEQIIKRRVGWAKAQSHGELLVKVREPLHSLSAGASNSTTEVLLMSKAGRGRQRMVDEDTFCIDILRTAAGHLRQGP
jgi:hypothetical protein